MAMGHGHTLTKAEAVLFAELVWVPAHIEQAEARAHRIGQQYCIQVQYLMLQDGRLDERYHSRLNQKHATVGVVMDGAAPPQLINDNGDSASA
eukprot:1778171-Amphidinium_carterae.1